MRRTIIGHEVEIETVGVMSSENEDTLIYIINNRILEGKNEGSALVHGLDYDWKIVYNTDAEEYENICFENKRMSEFLEKLGLTPDDITSFVINGNDDDIKAMTDKIQANILLARIDELGDIIPK